MKPLLLIWGLFWLFCNNLNAQNYIILKNNYTHKVYKIKQGRKIIFSLEGYNEVLKGRIDSILNSEMFVRVKTKINKRIEINYLSITFIGVKNMKRELCRLFIDNFQTNYIKNKNIDSYKLYNRFYLNKWELKIIKF